MIGASATAAAPTPATATLGAWFLLALVPIACCALVYLLLPADVRADPHAARPTVDVADGERIAFSGTVASGVLTVAAVLVWALWLIAVVVTGTTGAPVVAPVVLFLAGLATLALVPVRLTVDARGIRLTSVVLRVPLIRVALREVESVTAEQIDPLRWGGWGYRFSGAGRAYVAGRGPGIVVHRRTGSPIAIQTAAGVANGLLAREGAIRS